MESLLSRYPNLKVCKESVEKALMMMSETYHTGGKILLCGNGGSCADCEHIAGELMKGFLSLRKMKEEDREKFYHILGDDGEFFAENLQYGIPAVSLTCANAVNSAFNNDVEPSLVYAQGVWAMGDKNDLVIGISTSGNSKNVINALIAAKAKGIRTLGLTGKNECRMDKWCDCVVHAPECETYKVQELHLPIYHYLCAALEKELFVKENKND